MILEYNFCKDSKKSLELISDEWLYVVCLSSLLFVIFIIKKCVVFSLTSFVTLKYGGVIKTREIFSCFTSNK